METIDLPYTSRQNALQDLELGARRRATAAIWTAIQCLQAIPDLLSSERDPLDQIEAAEFALGDARTHAEAMLEYRAARTNEAQDHEE